MSAAVRPGDRATLTILAFQDELTALGLLPLPEGQGAAPPPPRIRATGKAPAVPCGTDGGARRHRRRGEPLCDPCKVAERAANAERHERARVRKQAAA